MSPTAVQASIWVGAAAVAALLGGGAWYGVSRPPQPHPRPVDRDRTPPPAPAEAKADGREAPHQPAMPEDAEPSEPAAPHALTEARFVETSAAIILAAEWVEESGEGEAALGEAVEAVFQQHGVDRAEFETMSSKIAADTELCARVSDAIQDRVTALQVGSAESRRPMPPLERQE